MDDDSLITCSISMERWKSASPRLGTCKVVIGILNKKVMDLEFIRLPVKPLLSLILSYYLFFLASQWVMSMIMLSTSSMASSLFVPISSQPTPFFPVSHRVDMDIAGTSNSLLRTSSIQEEVPRPWLDEDSDWGKTVIEQKIVKEYIENENDALLRYPPNFTGGYSFVNRDITNAWGYPRGYLIHPGNSPIFNVHFLVHFGNFLTHLSALTLCFSLLSSFRRL